MANKKDEKWLNYYKGLAFGKHKDHEKVIQFFEIDPRCKSENEISKSLVFVIILIFFRRGKSFFKGKYFIS
jgi:hypothetical protein